MVSQLSDMLSKEGFYPILKTLLINAEPYENPEAYRPQVPTRHFRKVRSVIPHKGAEVI